MLALNRIRTTRVERSKLNDIPLENIPFGKYFTDHMLEADYENGEWKNIEIKPYQPLVLSPSIAAIHYGQSIFEGIKAYKDQDNKPYIFRPEDNFKRFNASAKRMQMPEVPASIFMEGMKQLVALDANWIPAKPDHSLYIRPFLFASDEVIGVKPSETYKFMIILSPTGPYYAAPMKIYVEERFTRAAPGGVGFAKAAGNYAASMMATAEARKLGYDQVLWTDSHEHKTIQEIGTMNVFFVTKNKVITPSPDEGTILAGITRDSVMQVIADMDIEVSEDTISIDELIEFYKKGELLEVFGTGTAATVSMIRELRYRDFVMEFDTEQWKLTPAIKTILTDIREGRREDKWKWMIEVL